MSIPCKVLLVIPSEKDDIESADLVAKQLHTKYGISDVTIRSSRSPIDRLLNDDDDDGLNSSSSSSSSSATTIKKNVIWVFYSDPSVAATIGLIQEESPYPVLEVNAATTLPNDIALMIAKWYGLSCQSVAAKVRHATMEKRQLKLVQDGQLQTKSWMYRQAIANCYDGENQITGNNIGIEGTKRGKVRDRIELNDTTLALITTDRQSGFDRQLALVPYKGAVLNLTSAFWFEQTKHIISNHLIAVPHPYVTIAKKCTPFPIEFVVRSYMTGSTSTSIWKNYQNGVRNYCGHILPEGMKKNQKLEQNLLTPTTKEEEHDRPISVDDIVKEKWMAKEDLDVCSKAAMKIFELGQQIAFRHGLILVDTKYEFGKDITTGEILLIDEVHTPDSSRYWLASSYEDRIASDSEPENIDKEFLRLWFRDNCDPYNDKVIPDAPRDLVVELSRRYISLYEMITWKQFNFFITHDKSDGPKAENDIAKSIQSYMQ